MTLHFTHYKNDKGQSDEYKSDFVYEIYQMILTILSVLRDISAIT